MSTKVVVICDTCTIRFHSNANAAGTHPAEAARAQAETEGWRFAGTDHRRDYCPSCWHHNRDGARCTLIDCPTCATPGLCQQDRDYGIWGPTA